MFLKYRYRLGFEAVCREVTDSITWQRFCRIPLGGRVPHPTTLMKITTRCGQQAIEQLNEALLARAAEAKVLKTNRLRADTTVVEANVAYPSDSTDVERFVNPSADLLCGLLLGAPDRRFGACVLVSRRRGLGVKVERPQRSEDERP